MEESQGRVSSAPILTQDWEEYLRVDRQFRQLEKIYEDAYSQLIGLQEKLSSQSWDD